MGSRLWPLSHSLYPKQFIKIFDNLSLLQKTLIRNRTYGKPAVIIGEEHRFIAVEQMQEIGIEDDIIIEPYQKNTAPCTIIAALIAKQEKVDKVLLFPADHYIKDTEDYLSVINKSFRYADGVATIGIKPTFAHTGYGYIKAKKFISDGVFEAEKFVEKPSKRLAQNCIKSENYFLMSILCLSKLRIFKMIYINKFLLLLQISSKDEKNNSFEGNVIANGVNNSYVRSSGSLTAVIGLDNVVVINIGNTVLVADKRKVDEVKQIIKSN